MNRERRKEMKLKSLKKELKDSKWAYWLAEEKLVKLIVKINHKIPIINPKWGSWYKVKELARLELAKCEDERKEAQYNLDVFKRMEAKKSFKKKGKNESKSFDKVGSRRGKKSRSRSRNQNSRKR